MRLLLLTLAAILLPTAAVIGWGFIPPSKGVTERNCDRIQVGMSLEEVNGLIGTAGKLQSSVPMWGTGVPFVRGGQAYLWEKDGYQIWVGFDQGRVVSKLFYDRNYL
jgi:hypothetical protein